MAATAVEDAIRIAQDAVKADESGDFDTAIALYTKAVDLIKKGLQIQSEDESVDNTVLHRYAKLYSDRIAVLAEHGRGRAQPSSSAGAGASGASAFSFDDEEIAQAQPPPAAPADEWRRAFWLMRILRNSMSRGGFLSPDARVYVPKRVWLQKGARFTALQAKLDCAECLVNELRRICAVDVNQPKLVQKELVSLCETMDALQNSVSRLLPFIADAEKKGGSDKGMFGMKGLAKSLEKTAARLGTMPAKCSDPHEYIQTLVDLFDAAAFLEGWLEHYAPIALEHATIHQQLHRAAKFFYDVVCAFAVHDLNGLLARHMRKASRGFVEGSE
tara:strand:- start:339 stop:1328 length:990 start_codon:yes stop_codon:yes gene_type:complete